MGGCFTSYDRPAEPVALLPTILVNGVSNIQTLDKPEDRFDSVTPSVPVANVVNLPSVVSQTGSDSVNSATQFSSTVLSGFMETFTIQRDSPICVPATAEAAALLSFISVVAPSTMKPMVGTLHRLRAIASGMRTLRDPMIDAGISEAEISRLDSVNTVLETVNRIAVRQPRHNNQLIVHINGVDVSTCYARMLAVLARLVEVSPADGVAMVEGTSVADEEASRLWHRFGQSVGTLFHLLERTHRGRSRRDVPLALETRDAEMASSSSVGDAAVQKVAAEQISKGFLGWYHAHYGSSLAATPEALARSIESLDLFAAAVSNFEKETLVSIVKGLGELSDGFVSLRTALFDADGVLDDAKELKQALDLLGAPNEVVFHVGRELLLNGHQLFDLIDNLVVSFRGSHWEEFGTDLGDLVDVLLSHDAAVDTTGLVPSWLQDAVGERAQFPGFSRCPGLLDWCSHHPVEQDEIKVPSRVPGRRQRRRRDVQSPISGPM